jgi:hypothetical protein
LGNYSPVSAAWASKCAKLIWNYDAQILDNIHVLGQAPSFNAISANHSF